MTKITLTLVEHAAPATICAEQQGGNQSAPVENFDQLVAKLNCLACHAEGNQMGVPVWYEVAKKYQKMPDSEAYLSNKIRRGGAGSWGKMDMPPYQELEEPEMKVIVQGVLSSAKPGSQH